MERVRPWVEAIPLNGNISLDEDFQIDDDVQKNYVITLDDEPYTAPPQEKEIDRTPSPVPPELKSFLKSYKTLQDVVEDEQMSRWLNQEFRNYQFFHPTRQANFESFPLKISPQLVAEYFEMKRKKILETNKNPYALNNQLYALHELYQTESNIENVDLGNFEKSQKISKGYIKEYYKWRKQMEEKNKKETEVPEKPGEEEKYERAVKQEPIN